MQLYSDSFVYHCTIHQSNTSLPYLLMLHGFMGSEKVFEHLINPLASICNPITIDLAGHGQTKSSKDPKKYRAKRQINQLHSLIRRLQLNDIYLYGYSMGGRLAFQVIASHPDLFSGVVIESSHCGIDSKTERLKRQSMDEKRAQNIENDFGGFIDKWSEIPLFQHTPSHMKSVYREVMKSQDPQFMSASIRGFGAGVMPYVCDKMNGSNFSLTLIAGELDDIYVLRMKNIHKFVHGSSFDIVPNAGHRAHADQPQKLIVILRDTFLSK